MNNLPTVTVGIPAYNEEANIHTILQNVLSQKEDGFVIEKIVVLNDGSSDKTAEYAKIIKDKRIEVVDDGRRTGKPSRLNQLYKLSESDFIITFDADVALVNNRVIYTLVKSFNNTNVGLVGGRDVPQEPSSFFERVVVMRLGRISIAGTLFGTT